MGVWNDTPLMVLYGLDDPHAGYCFRVGTIRMPEELAPKECKPPREQHSRQTVLPVLLKHWKSGVYEIGHGKYKWD